jgi:hypothetical protein
MYKIAEQGYNKIQIKNYNEYIADTFDELPTDAQFGDRAIFNDNGVMKIAIRFSDGWIRSE